MLACSKCLNKTSSLSCNFSMTNKIFHILRCLITYLKGLPALIIQFSHLLSDPCRNVRNGHMDDILQEDGKMLQTDRQVKRWCGTKQKIVT